jgi:hypothetical protein
MVFLSYFLFKKYYITWFIISNHYKLNVLIYYRLLIVCNTSCLIWTTILWRKMLCRVYSLFHRISKKHYFLNFSLFIEYIVTYYCPFSFLLRLYIIEVFIDRNMTKIPYFVSISLAYYNAAILCLPHTSNLLKNCMEFLIKLYLCSSILISPQLATRVPYVFPW